MMWRGGVEREREGVEGRRVQLETDISVLW